MQLKDYIQGDRRGKEANRLEREAMNDPFLQDALEGFDAVPGDHAKIIEQLEKRIVSKNNRRFYLYGSVAATILLLIGFGFLFLLDRNDKKDSIVMLQSVETPAAPEMPIQSEIISDSRTIEPTKSSSAIPAQEEAPTARMQSSESAKPSSTMSAKAPSPRMPSSEAVKPSSAIPVPQEMLATEQEAEKMVDEDTLGSIIAVAEFAAEDTDVKILTVQDAKKIVLSGKIVDENGIPLAGVSILNKSTNTGVITDIDGFYNLQLNKGDSTNLVASYIGYEPRIIAFSNITQTIALLPDTQSLSEVVVTGYGVQKRSSLTGSISKESRSQRSAGSQTTRKRTDHTDVSDTRQMTFGENEFQAYCRQKADKNVCGNKKVAVKVSFFINENGKPTNIHFISYTCEYAKKEIENLLTTSPVWTTINKKVTMTIRWN